MGDEWQWQDERFEDFKHFFERYWTEQELKEKEDIPNLDNLPADIAFKTGTSEMLRVTPEGFYVRGVRVEADDDEARKVYSVFKQWLTWAMLNGEGK